VNTATEYRDLPLNLLTESTTNPRRVFDDAPLRDLAESIRAEGVLSPLLVRPLTEQSFEIVAGARRFRAAQMAEVSTVPVRIVQWSATIATSDALRCNHFKFGTNEKRVPSSSRSSAPRRALTCP
jgi:ParB/RepB/Spo0J family partition protein